MVTRMARKNHEPFPMRLLVDQRPGSPGGAHQLHLRGRHGVSLGSERLLEREAQAMETTMTGHGNPAEMCQTRRWAILATMLLGTALAILDNSILYILVIPLMEAFQADLRTVKWVLTSYSVVLAIYMIGFGGLGDAVGRRRLYLIGQEVLVLVLTGAPGA